MTPISDIKKIELAHEVLSIFKNRCITINDRVDVIKIVMNLLLAKKRQYNRGKNISRKAVRHSEAI